MTISVLLLTVQTLAAPLTLEQAILRARDSAASNLSAQQRLTDDSLTRHEVLGHFLPKVELSASQLAQSSNIATFGIPMHGVPNYVPFYSIQDLRASASVPLVNAALWSRLHETRSSLAQRGQEKEVARELAALQGGVAWLEVARAKALTKDREDAVRLAHELTGLVEEQKQAGGATRLDLVRAQAQELQAQRALSAARLSLEKARLALGRLLGVPGGEPVDISGDLPLEPVAAGVAAKTEPVAVRAARAGREAANEAVRTARADELPTLSAFGDYGYLGTHLEKDGEWTGKVGIQASWELFDGGSKRTKVEKARVRVRLAEIAVRDARLAASQDEQDALVSVKESGEQLRQAMAASLLADTELVLAQEKFKAGASGNSEVVQAQGGRSQAHAAWIDAAGAHQAALLRLRYARGNWEGLQGGTDR